MFPIEANFLNDVTIRVDGTIKATQDFKNWPHDHKSYVPWWFFNDCNNIRFEGKGVLDGQGYMWWVREFLGKNLAHRP